VVRKNSELLANTTGKTLFPELDDYQKYRYSANVTTAAISEDLVWEVYYNTPQLLDQKVRDAKLIFRVVLSSILV
jgi:hypothetical protein